MTHLGMSLDNLPGDACQWCQAPLSDTRRAGTIYCSKTCAHKHYAALDKQGRAEARAGMTCRECGAIFDAARSDQLYCGRACARVAMRKRTWGYRNCAICGTRYLPSRGDQKICRIQFMECVRQAAARAQD